MMENKIYLKKFLITTLIFGFLLLSLFVVINLYEYKIYTRNFNNKIDEITSVILTKYPEITENEILSILNKKDDSKRVLEKYNINLNNDSVILINEDYKYKFLIINSCFIIIIIILLIIIFLIFDNKKDKEIKKITKCVEEINKKNYKLNIDEISEDELSILRNEIYKITIMLKEDAENSKKEKLQLKDSLSDISHQLKTPLTSILIMIDNLIEDKNMDEVLKEEFLHDIKREIMSINFFVQNLLKLSKLDTNAVTFNKNKTHIKDIIDESIKKLSSLCDLRNIKIDVNVIEDSSIICDYKWQIEAITNIIKNCIEHSSNGGKIYIEVDDNKLYSSITIRDYGTGICSEDLPHIFERFYKGKNATNDSVGIGLSLSKTIIEKDNGTISVSSSEKGTIFNIKYIY